ncbi:MAG TPA: hypothetical protein VGV10_06130 [Thermoleophilaceae bacterium]|nr:hypothetical protein [Thermoleophilaceae bacterium]
MRGRGDRWRAAWNPGRGGHAGTDPRLALTRERAVAPLTALLIVAIVVSVLHYSDNVVNFEDYPQPGSGPAPSATVIALAWFVFTAAGLAGLALFRRGRVAAAAAALALYSASGLVGLGHYSVEGASAMPWWRHAHVVADIGCGVAVLAFAVWAARRWS